MYGRFSYNGDSSSKAQELTGARMETSGEVDSEMQKQMSLVFLGVMTAEITIEQERLGLSENNEFYPEVVFNYLKNYQHLAKQAEAKPSFQSFFDFSSPIDVMQYNQLNSYKSGFVPYVELLSLLNSFNVACTDKVLECIIKQIDPLGFTNGLSYDAFLQLVAPQSIPFARQKVYKRKIIYETNPSSDHRGVIQSPTVGANQINNQTFPPASVIKSIVTILDLESNMITFTEKSRVKIQNNINKCSISSLFGVIDQQKMGFLDYRSVQQFIKKTKNQMVPNQYLGLLRRLKKPESTEMISFQDFKDFLAPNFPFFSTNNTENINQIQQYHEINKSLDISKTQQIRNSVENLNTSSNYPKRNSVKPTFSSQKNLLAHSTLHPYEDAESKIFFKDKQGRIIEKNHPHEAAFIPEDPSLTEILKQNRNVIHHPQERTTYTLVPEQYLEQPPKIVNPPKVKEEPKSYLLPEKSKGQYQMPKVDPKDLTGVDPFWWRTQKQSTQQVNDQNSKPKPAPSPLDQVDQVTDPLAKQIISEYQKIIKDQKQQLSKSLAAAPAPKPVNPPNVQIGQKFQENYQQSPFIQDIVQLRHTNTVSYGQVPLQNNATDQLPQSQFLRNTNLLQSQYNAKINPHDHNKQMQNKALASQQIVANPNAQNNVVSLQFHPIPIQQQQNITQVTKQKSTKQRIFDSTNDLRTKGQLNDRNFHFQNINQFYN